MTKTDVFLLGLTALFMAAGALTWLLSPRQTQGGYDISAVPSTATAPERLTVNINTAGAEELESLPGIGPVLARRIVEDRAANGPFGSRDALLRVEGIGQAILEGIQDFIVTEDVQE